MVDFLAERNVHATQVKHLEALGLERSKTFDKLSREEQQLKHDLAAAKQAAKASSDRQAKVRRVVAGGLSSKRPCKAL